MKAIKAADPKSTVNKDRYIPRILRMLIDWLTEHSLRTQGIFRISASHAAVGELIINLESGSTSMKRNELIFTIYIGGIHIELVE